MRSVTPSPSSDVVVVVVCRRIPRTTRRTSRVTKPVKWAVRSAAAGAGVVGDAFTRNRLVTSRVATAVAVSSSRSAETAAAAARTCLARAARGELRNASEWRSPPYRQTHR